MKHDDVTRLVNTLDSSPVATISVVMFISPRRKKAIVIDKATFEVKESLSLPLYAPSNIPQARFGT